MNEQDKWLLKLSKTVNRISEEYKDDFYIGPVGKEGLYQIGKGAFTSLQGYKEFINELDIELKKK